MCKSLGSIFTSAGAGLCLLFALLCAGPCAKADSITSGTINFILTEPGGPAATGSFVFDNTTNLYLNLTISWDGVTFPFIGFFNGANDKLRSSGVWCANANTEVVLLDCQGLLPATFLIQSVNTFQESLAFGGTFTDPLATAVGTYTTTETTTTTPEPSSVPLILSGMAFLMLLRSIGQRLGPAG